MADADRPVTGLPILDHFDSRLVQELALGYEDEDAILARYGFDEAGIARLKADAFLHAEVQALTTELRRAGTMAKIKARLAAEELITIAFQRAKATKTLAEALDALKIFAKIGDLEPRNDGGGKLTGTIVRVDLNIGQLGFAPATVSLPTILTDVRVVEDAIPGTPPALNLPVDDLEWVCP